MALQKFGLSEAVTDADSSPGQMSKFTSDPVRLGTVDGVPIIAEMGGGLGPSLVEVTLLADYHRKPDRDYPAQTPAGEWSFAAHRVISAGTTFYVVYPEAIALANAGAATIGASYHGT